MSNHWTELEKEALKYVSTMEGVTDVALIILGRMKKVSPEIIQICGPMSTGGLGNLEANMLRFKHTISAAEDRGLTVFNQVVFQEAIIRISDFKEGSAYNMEILEVFYHRIFHSRHINKAMFLHDWHTSFGATWERNLITKLGIPIENYPSDWLKNFELGHSSSA